LKISTTVVYELGECATWEVQSTDEKYITQQCKSCPHKSVCTCMNATAQTQSSEHNYWH